MKERKDDLNDILEQLVSGEQSEPREQSEPVADSGSVAESVKPKLKPTEPKEQREQREQRVKQEQKEQKEQFRLEPIVPTEAGVKRAVQKLKRLSLAMRKTVFGRDKLVSALVFGLASNQHILIVGSHGEAKSYLSKKLVEYSGLNEFYFQVHNETMVKDVVGLINPIAYKEGRLELIETKFWDAHLLYFDEFLRGRTEFLDFLHEVMQERVCSKTVVGERALPVVSVVCTSNPLTDDYNTERLDLALKDRFAVIVEIEHLIKSSPAIVEKVIKEHDESISFNGKLKIGADELRAIPVWANEHVKTDTTVVRGLFEVLKRQGYLFSTRFIKRFNLSLRVWALLQGRKEAIDRDYLDVADLLLGSREDGLNANGIKNAVEQALSVKQFEPINKRLNQLNRKGGKEFVKQYVELIHELRAKSEASIPDLIKDKRDKLEGKFRMEFKSSHDAISRDIELLKKMQSEYFREHLEELAEFNEVETAYLTPDKAKKFDAVLKSVDRNGKLFQKDSDRATDDGETLVKWSIAPRADVPESYNRIKTLRVKAKPFMSRS